MAEEHIQRLLADARTPTRGTGRRVIAALLTSANRSAPAECQAPPVWSEAA
jgi:hypothetical protein